MQPTELRAQVPRDRQAPLSRCSEPPARAAHSLSESASPAYRTAIRQIELYARCDDPVLLVGESGTGKTLLAEQLHRRSARASGVFHRVAVSGLADSLVTSELFGHLRGSFSDARERRAGHFVTANHGTLFLDEIGKASEATQCKLLDAVDRKEVTPLGADRPIAVDIRIIAATNIPLGKLVAERKFLPDLRARLGVFIVTLPPLRERRADIPALVLRFVALHAGRYGYGDDRPSVHPDLMDLLATADWPDNIRQLEGVVRNILLTAEGATLLTTSHCANTELRPARRRRGASLTRASIEAALCAAEGKPDRAAAALGVSRATLYRDARAAGMETVGSTRVREGSSHRDMRQSEDACETNPARDGGAVDAT